MNRLFLLLLIGTVSYIGFRMGEGSLDSRNQTVILDVHPEREFPLTEYRSFAFIVYAANQGSWCERSLASLFAQNYDYYRIVFIDDASTDGTYEIAKNYIIANAQDERVILIRNETRLGPIASLYRVIETCLDREVVIPMQAKDWLSQEGALTRLNGAFQNPDVWMAQSTKISYPSYDMEGGNGLRAFYAGLLKQIRLDDLFIDGELSANDQAYLGPLLELSGGRVRSLGEPLLFSNQAGFGPKVKNQCLPQRRSYEPLAQFPLRVELNEKTDLLIYSNNRPLQLHAMIESIERYVTGYEQITVLYNGSDERYTLAYHQLKKNFPNVQFIRHSSEKDLKHFKSRSDYLLLATDDLIVNDYIDLKACMGQMQRTGSHKFHFQSKGTSRSNLPLGEGIFASDERGLGEAEMTLYRREELEPLKVKHFHPLRENLSIALYFEHSKVIKMPLESMSSEELLAKWGEGLKIDIDPLFRVETPSPEVEFTGRVAGSI